MKCRDCENLIWSYAEGERIWQCRERYCPDLDIERDCPDFAPQKPDIFTALSTLQAENERLKDQLYDGEGTNLVEYWMQQAKIEENGHRNCQAENEKLRAELEQVKRERDEAVQCIRGIAKSGRVWMCPYCVHAKDTTGGIAECELDVGVCMVPYSKFEWRGPQKED